MLVGVGCLTLHCTVLHACSGKSAVMLAAAHMMMPEAQPGMGTGWSHAVFADLQV